MPTPAASYIEAIKNSDEPALRKLYAEFLPRISAFIQRNGGTAEDAQDIFQDALITVYKKSKSPDFKLTSNFYTFLYGICRNLWGNRLQKKSRTEVSMSDTHVYNNIPDLSVQIGEVEEQRLFWDAFSHLGEDCQRLLQLFFAKVKMQEITRRLNLSSVGYAKKKKFQCKERLVELVKKDQRYAELKLN